MFEGTPAEEDRRIRGEGELTAELIVAAKASDEPLSEQQIDSILGLGRDRSSG
jgi:hypothetical protein